MQKTDTVFCFAIAGCEPNDYRAQNRNEFKYTFFAQKFCPLYPYLITILC